MEYTDITTEKAYELSGSGYADVAPDGVPQTGQSRHHDAQGTGECRSGAAHHGKGIDGGNGMTHEEMQGYIAHHAGGVPTMSNNDDYNFDWACVRPLEREEFVTRACHDLGLGRSRARRKKEKSNMIKYSKGPSLEEKAAHYDRLRREGANPDEAASAVGYATYNSFANFLAKNGIKISRKDGVAYSISRLPLEPPHKAAVINEDFDRAFDEVDAAAEAYIAEKHAQTDETPIVIDTPKVSFTLDEAIEKVATPAAPAPKTLKHLSVAYSGLLARYDLNVAQTLANITIGYNAISMNRFQLQQTAYEMLELAELMRDES